MSNELYHYGVLHRSGRYPYGSGERPYQGEGGGGFFARRKERKARIAAAKAQAEQERLEKEREERIRQKDAALASKSATQIYKVKDDLSDKELQDILTRLNREKQLLQFSKEEIAAGKTFVKKMDNLQAAVNKVLGYYSTYQKVAKLLGSSSSDGKASNSAKKAADEIPKIKISSITNQKSSKDYNVVIDDLPKEDINTVIEALGDVPLIDIDLRKK